MFNSVLLSYVQTIHPSDTSERYASLLMTSQYAVIYPVELGRANLVGSCLIDLEGHNQ
jgi:hypothetical protein